MKQSVPPAFQFYARDFLSSDKVSRMTMEERGAYITLLCHAWMSGSGLPNDLEQLARYLRLPMRQFRKLWNSPLKECFVESNGRLVNLRQEQVRREQEQYRQQQIENGRRGGRPRKGENGNPDESQNKPTLSSGFSKTPLWETDSKAKPNPNETSASASASAEGTSNMVPSSEVPALSIDRDVPTGEQRPGGRNPDSLDISSERKSDLSRAPADDRNFSVLVRLAHAVMDDEGDGDPTNPNIIEAVKTAAAQRRIAYLPDTLSRALRSAGTQRLRGTRPSSAPGPLADLAERVKTAIDDRTLPEAARALAGVKRR